jgi:hypothetical protein
MEVTFFNLFIIHKVSVLTVLTSYFFTLVPVAFLLSVTVYEPGRRGTVPR